jgi:hypothetical protein
MKTNHDQQAIEAITVTLRKYLPEKSVHWVANWIVKYHIAVRITPKRKSVQGTYRPPFGNRGHEITINGDLNQYAFLITFIHEFAHLLTWEKYKNTVLPHGKEWKGYYKEIIKPFFELRIFPMPIHEALLAYMANPAAATCRDEELMKTLQSYNKHPENTAKYLADLPDSALFKLEDGRIFRKGEKLRKYFRCVEVKTNKIFRVNGLLTVEPVKG